jgi:hypothetical protein
MNNDFTNKTNNLESDDLRPEYDFSQMSGGIRGKYVERYRTGQNLVLLDPDIAQAFPTSQSVNEALRLLLQIAQRQELTTSPDQNP